MRANVALSLAVGAAVVLAAAGSVAVVAADGVGAAHLESAVAIVDGGPVDAAGVDELTIRSGRSIAKVTSTVPAGVFGGAYLDRATGRVKVMVTRPVPLPALDLDRDAAVDLVVVETSLVALEAGKDAVFAARDQLAAAGVHLAMVDADEVSNALLVSVTPSTDLTLARDRVDDLAPGVRVSLTHDRTGGVTLY